MNKVIHNPAEHRFKLLIEVSDGDIAAAYYRIEDGAIVQVPFQYSGQGLGSQLARGMFDTVCERGQSSSALFFHGQLFCPPSRIFRYRVRLVLPDCGVIERQPIAE